MAQQDYVQNLMGKVLQGAGGVMGAIQNPGRLMQSLGQMAWLTGEARAGTPNIDEMQIQAELEGSADKANQMAEKLAPFKNRPKLLNFFIDKDEYWQKHPRGKRYLKALLEQKATIEPSKLAPTEREALYRKRGGALPFVLAGIQKEEVTPEIEREFREAMAPWFATQGYPTERLGVRKTEEIPGWKTYVEQMWGTTEPATAGQAAAARLKGEEMPPEPVAYTDWLKSMQVEYRDLPEGDRPMVDLLTRGGAALRLGYPRDMDIRLLREYPSLVTDMTLRQMLGLEAPEGQKNPELHEWDASLVKDQPLIARLAAYIKLYNTVGQKLGDDAMNYIFKDWFKDLFGRGKGAVVE